MRLVVALLGVVFLLGASCDSSEADEPRSESAPALRDRAAVQPVTQAVPDGQAVAVFAGGCFWCTESDFERVEGVSAAVSGYTGGTSDNPTYDQVSSHRSDHLEAVRIVYDPSVITYAEMVERFFHSVDPTQANGQFCDRGAQYRTAIFVANEEERGIAEAAKRAAGETLGETIVTEILDAGRFWDAEDYHQDFYRTTPARYNSYRQGCGRDERVRELWGSGENGAAAAH